jgi:putative ABC transport system substrate-binding protein
MDLVKLKTEVVVAVSTPAIKAMQRVSTTTPVVFTQVTDPLGQGIVRSIAKPGGNVTGFTNYDPAIGGKWLELLKAAAPNVDRVAVVFNPQVAPYAALYLRSMATVAPSIKMKVAAMPARDETEIETAFKAFASEPGGGLIVLPDAFIAVHRNRVIALSAQLKLPALYPFRYYAAAGGLMSYGVDQVEQMRGAATYVDRILRGERPGDLPLQAPTRFRLAINVKSAEALGLKISVPFLLRADEVIE